MPAKKKAAKKAAEKPSLPSFEEACGGMDFPCDASTAKARELYAQYGERFAKAMSGLTDAVPLSFLEKVVEPTFKGKPPKKTAHVSIKERTKEA